MPTVAVVALLTFGLRSLFFRCMAGRSMGLADSGGERSICRFCSGDETSRGSEDGCEQSADAAVTWGCLRDSVRLREMSRFLTVGLGSISHSGSWDSTFAVQASFCADVVRPTTMVMDSLSESKL